MKRLNPKTNLPFKKGDIREDGYAFYQYRKIIKPDGYFVEYWLKPDKFNNHNFKNRSGNTRLLSYVASGLISHAKTRCNGSAYRTSKGRLPTNGKVTITLEWVIERILKGVCEATGDVITIETRKSNTVSLDRIDPNNPDYTPENSRIVTWQFNNMKGAYSDKEFIRVAENLKKTLRKNANKK